VEIPEFYDKMFPHYYQVKHKFENLNQSRLVKEHEYHINRRGLQSLSQRTAKKLYSY